MSDSSSGSSILRYEHVINRWTFDFYVFKAFSAFRNGDYTAFAHFTNIIESLAVRPMDGHRDVIVKMRFMQFLSRINNGEKLDLTFEEPKTPLESALDVLESICRDMNVSPREQELVCHAVSEMLVIVCIRSGEFEKAEEMLKHLSTAADSTGKKKLFVNLIRRRRSCHSVLQLSNYSEFKQDMLNFIERLHRAPEPFLLQMLKRSGVSAELMRSSQGGQPATQKPSVSKQTAAEDHGSVCISLHSLRQVYGLLSAEYGVSLPFSQLQQEVEVEVQQESSEPSGPELHLSLSETPLEQTERASDSGQQDGAPTRYTGMTISRLVQEDDSLTSEEDHRDPQSDDAELQTCPSSPLSVKHTSADKQKHHREAEAHRSSPQDPSSSRPLRHTARDTRRYKRILMSSDLESDDHSTTPPSVRHTSTHEEQRDHRRICESSESEPEVHNSSPRLQACHSSPPSSPPGRTHPAKRSRWQDAPGTQENWSDEDSLFGSSSGAAGRKCSRKMWTPQESKWLKEGVRRFGVGHWERIRSAFPFSGRTAVNLKDRWRTMVRLKLV